MTAVTRPNPTPPSRLHRAVSGIGAIGASQAITAGGSLTLQIIAARELGLGGLGAFALCLSLLTTTTALYSGYIGDGLTVLDRRDPAVRGPLVLAAVTGLVVAFGLAFGLVLALHLGSVVVGVIYAAMIVGWLIEETGRRVLMARLEFWRLVVNDAVYVGVTLLSLTIAVAAGASISLGLMLAAMALGAGVAIVIARLQLPGAEYRELAPRAAGTAEVGHFALWRSLQAALRPSELLVSRLLLQQIAGLAVVGAVEAGRLVVAPIQTALGGVSAFLLSTGAHDERQQPYDGRRNERVAGVLISVTLAAGALAAALSGPLGELVVKHRLPHLLVLGWALYMATWAASLPFTAELTVRRLSWPIFLARLVEVAAALVLVAAVLGAGGPAQAVPWLLAGPGLVNTWYLRHLAITTRHPRAEDETTILPRVPAHWELAPDWVDDIADHESSLTEVLLGISGSRGH